MHAYTNTEYIHTIYIYIYMYSMHALPNACIYTDGFSITAIKHMHVIYSLPEFMDFIPFGKTFLVVNNKFTLLFGPSTQEVNIHTYIYI